MRKYIILCGVVVAGMLMLSMYRQNPVVSVDVVCFDSLSSSHPSPQDTVFVVTNTTYVSEICNVLNEYTHLSRVWEAGPIGRLHVRRRDGKDTYFDILLPDGAVLRKDSNKYYHGKNDKLFRVLSTCGVNTNKLMQRIFLLNQQDKVDKVDKP